MKAKKLLKTLSSRALVGQINMNFHPVNLPIRRARSSKKFYFLISVYWPFVPDVNGFHFGIQTEMDDLLNAVGLTMKASMNDVVVLQVKCNHSIRVTNYCLSSATRTVI